MTDTLETLDAQLEVTLHRLRRARAAGETDFATMWQHRLDRLLDQRLQLTD